MQSKKLKKFFFLFAMPDISEYIGILHPHKVYTILLKNKLGFKLAFHSIKRDHVRALTIPKLGRGYFNQPADPSLIDHILYMLTVILLVPYILTFKRIIYRAPPYLNNIIMPLMKLFGKKQYLIIMDSQLYIRKTLGKDKGLQSIITKLMERQEINSIKRADKVFAVSKYLCDYCKRYNKNVFLVPNGADVDYIAAIKPIRTFKDFTIVYLGGFEKFRGVDMLIDSFKIVQKKYPKAKLLLIGGGSEDENIKKMIKNNPNIRLMGYVVHDKAQALVKGSDIAVMPARDMEVTKTISSQKSYEYVADEVPIVVTDIGDHVEYIKKYGFGVVVKDNAESVAEGILKLMKDKKLYSRIKNNCRKNKKYIDFKNFKKVYVEEITS